MDAGRRLNRAAGMLAFSVLADSALEHYRGSFHNPAMLTPLVVSSLALAVSVHGLTDRTNAGHTGRNAVYVGTLLTGIAGCAFHAYNVLKRPGGLTWQNVFYGAPLGAPVAIALSGLFGTIAEQLRDTNGDARPEIVGLPAGRVTAVLAAGSLAGTMGEVGLLHVRGADHNPVMFVPVTLPGVGALALLATAMRPKNRNHWLTRWWLRLTAAMGIAGVGFHAYAVQRNMGGWRNWRQNLLSGPPLPAPPSFTGIALAGLAALALMEEHPHA